MASTQLHSVNIRVDGENPEAVEAIRRYIAGCLEDKITAHGRTEISTRDKYRGNGLARMTAVVSQELLDGLMDES
jgi:hypothetical protein